MTQLLPNGKQQFEDANGRPLIGGKVFHYQAGTSTPKDTYQDVGQTTFNTNPIILDARGQASIYGTGAYRQVLQDSYGNLIWDQVISDSGADASAAITALQTNLANNTDAAKGAALVGFKGKTVADHLREKLYANRTYYVRTDGNDSNTGLANTAAGAFLTIQRAANYIQTALDLNGFTVTVQVGDGTYTAGAKVAKPWVGGGTVAFIGNVATPASCVVNANDVQGAFYAEQSAAFEVRGFKVMNTGGDGVAVQSGAFMSVGAMEYGASLSSHLAVGGGAFIYLTADYTVSGGGNSHLHTGSFGLIFTSVITCTVTGTPAFISYFAGAAQGNIIVKNVTFNGSATGARYLAHKGGIIETSPAFAPALPGSIDGRTTWGGVYLGSNTEPYNISVNTASAAAMNINAFDGATQTFRKILSCVTDPSGTGRGYLYANGPGSYLSNMTHLGTDTQVIASSGTADGVTVNAGGEINASRPSAPCGYLRRRTTDGQVLVFYRDLTFSGAISVSAGATTYGTTSDYRLKQNVLKLDGALDRIKGLQAKTFEMIAAPGVRVDGFLAHEVSRVVPNAVIGEKDAMQDVGSIVDAEGRLVASGVVAPTSDQEGQVWHKTGETILPQTVDHSKLVPLLVAALQDLSGKFDAYVASHP
jgi:hypothetical protein